MEVPVKRIAPGYFKLSKMGMNREFSLLIPARWRTDLTFGELRRLFGTDPRIKLNYIYKRTSEPTGRVRNIRLRLSSL